VPHVLLLNSKSHVALPKFHMAPLISYVISSGSKKKEPRCVCLTEAKSTHSHKLCTEISFSAKHFPQVGLRPSPITYKCLLKVLCPVWRPITTLDCVPLKGFWERKHISLCGGSALHGKRKRSRRQISGLSR
jgi:hypothetical protein